MATDDREFAARFGPGADLKRALTIASKVVDDVLVAAMAQCGLSVGEADVLTVLLVAGGSAAPSEMADWLRLTTAGMTGRLNTLDGKGLVERRPHQSDGRRLEVVLTPAGRALAETVIESKDEALQAHIVDHLGDDAARSLIEALDALVSATETTSGRPTDRTAQSAERPRQRLEDQTCPR